MASPKEERPREPRARRRRGRFSSLTWRILAINLLALVIVVAGMLYLDTYRRGLIEAKTAVLGAQGTVIAAALAESVVTGEDDGPLRIDEAVARQMFSRLIAPINTRARLYDAESNLLADSRSLAGAWASVQAASLPPPASLMEETTGAIYDWVVSKLPARRRLEPYRESAEPHGDDYAEIGAALDGALSSVLRDGGETGVILNLAIPVQRFKQVQGVLLLTADTADIEDKVRAVRFQILQISALALAITISLSLYLAGTIARPLYRLVEAVDAVRYGHQAGASIPEFPGRGDEIGDLSRALGDMILIAKVIARGALMRDECRGAHYKPEFAIPGPDSDKPAELREQAKKWCSAFKTQIDRWLKTTVAEYSEDGPKITYEEVDTSLIPPRPRTYGLKGAEIIDEVWRDMGRDFGAVGISAAATPTRR